MSIFDPGLIAKKEGDSCTDSQGRKGKVHFPPFFCPPQREGEEAFGCAAVMPQPICKVSQTSQPLPVQDFDFFSSSSRRTARQKRTLTQQRTDRTTFQEKARQLKLKRASRKKSLTKRSRT